VQCRRGSRGSALAAAVAVAVALVVLGLAGCGGRARSSTRATTTPSTTVQAAPAETVAPAADPDGALTLAVGPEPTDWNLHAAAGASPVLQEVLDPVWPSVWHTAPDGNLELDTAFVESATVTSLAPQTVVYRINPQAVWSDGVPITYRDFVYAWQSQSGSAEYRDVGGRPFVAAGTAGYSQIASVGEVGRDADEVRVVWSRPDPDWQALFATLVPAHVAQRIGFSNGFTDPVADDVSGGPFLIQSRSPGTSVTEVRNPRYWGTPAGLASVTFRFLADPAQVGPALAGDDVDAALLAPGADLAALRQTLGASAVVTAVASESFEDLTFDERNRWLGDPAIRQAISLAVDRPALLAATVGRDDPALTPLDNHLFVPGELGFQDDSGNLYDDAQDAKALTVLAGAGYDSTGGILTKDGQPVTLPLVVAGAPDGSTHGSAYGSAVAQMVVAELAGIGITVSVVSGAAGAAAGGGLAVQVVDDSPFLSTEDGRYQTVEAGTGGGLASGRGDDGFSDAAVDSLLAEASGTFDATARRVLYDRIDVLLWRDDADLPLFPLPVAVATSVTVAGLAPNPTPDGPTWNMADWSLPATP
jgi:peptide/nickel transport system substrate-binding protein